MICTLNYVLILNVKFMGFFGARISRAFYYDEQQEREERLRKMGRFSMAEIDHLHEVTDVDKDEIVDILESIFDPELSHEEKVLNLEDVRTATHVLIALATMERQF